MVSNATKGTKNTKGTKDTFKYSITLHGGFVKKHVAGIDFDADWFLTERDSFDE